MNIDLDLLFDDALNDAANYGRPQPVSLFTPDKNEASSRMVRRFKRQLEIFLRHMPDGISIDDILEKLDV